MSTRSDLFLATMLLVPTAPAALAEQLEITGELLTSTCRVQTTGGAISVPMGKVDLASVNASTRAGQKNFSITLDCTGSGAAQEVGVRFGGAAHGSSGNLALTGASTARNVGVAIYDADGRHQKIGDDPTHWVTVAAGATGVLGYSAWYSASGQDAEAGTANASGNFVVLYK
jgi:type 1 fimbria pilin